MSARLGSSAPLRLGGDGPSLPEDASLKKLKALKKPSGVVCRLRAISIACCLTLGYLTAGALPVAAEPTGESFGTPLTQTFSRRDYGGGPQVFGIAENAQGLLYFIEPQSGLLEYDGERWRHYELPFAAKALEADHTGRLWIGAPGEIGYMKADEVGNLEFHSLVHLLPEDQRSFSDVWPILATSQGVFFMAREYLFRYLDGRITSWPGGVDEVFYRGYDMDGRLFFAQIGAGLSELVDDRLVAVGGDRLPDSAEITAMFSRDDGSSWVITRLHGVYLLRGMELNAVEVPAGQWFIDHQVQHGCVLPGGGFAIASRRGGVAVLDRDLRLLKVLDKTSGLINNPLSYVKVDLQGNLWVASNGGISRVILDPSLSLYGPESGLEGRPFVAERHQGRLVVGTRLGLFLGNEDSKGRISFTSIPELPTGTWAFESADDVLLTATTDGVFEVRLSDHGDLNLHWVRRLTYEPSQNLLRPVSSPDHALVSVGNGLQLLKRERGEWRLMDRIDGVKGEPKSLVEGPDGETLAWVPGLDTFYVLRFENGYDAPPQISSYPAAEGSAPFELQGRILRNAGDGYERYLGVEALDSWPFEPTDDLAPFAEADLFPILQEDNGRLWVFDSTLGIGLAQPKDENTADTPLATNAELTFRPIAAQPLDDASALFPDPALDDTYWIPVEAGLYRWRPSTGGEPRPRPRALIRRVSLLPAGEILYSGSGRLDTPVLPYTTNSLRFEFAAPIFDQQTPVSYQVLLEEFDTQWSAWGEESFKEYSNLPEGNYSFRARALDTWGQVSTEARFDFRVSPPWYRTPWSYFAAALGFGLLIFLGLRWRTHRHIKELRRLEQLVAHRTEELKEGKLEVERQASALEMANRRLAEENEHRRLLEAEQVKLQSRVEQSQKLESLGLVAGGVAHDFNNILMAILGNADLALEDDTMDAAELRRRMHEIRRASRRAAELCRQMLAYAGKEPLRQDEVDLTTLTESSLDLVRSTVPPKIELRPTLAPDLPAVLADPTQLRQVAMNLILNAVESFEGVTSDAKDTARPRVVEIDTGAVRLDPTFFQETILADPLPGGDYVYLKVKDNGSGMDAETQKRIFDPFFTTKFTGRGLGLAAVLGIVRSHRGTLRVNSRPGEGTTLEMFLPALDHRADPSGTGSWENIGSWYRTGTVLVVDDEEIVRSVVSVMLRNTGFEVLLAADGSQALELFAEHRQDIVVVIMDLSIPGSSSQELFERLRQIDPDVRVVLSSGYSADQITERYLEEGFAGFLRKPYRANTLRELLKSLLDAPPDP